MDEHVADNEKIYHFQTHANDEVATWIQTNLSDYGSYGYLQSKIIECASDDKPNLFTKFVKKLHELEFDVIETQMQYEDEIKGYVLVTFYFLFL